MGLVDVAFGRSAKAAKAVTGNFASVYSTGIPIDEAFRKKDPLGLMAEGKAYFRLSLWVAAAERAIAGRILQTPWRLEDQEGDTITPQSHPQVAELFDVIAPTPVGGPISVLQMSTATRRALWDITIRELGLCGTTFWLLDEREVLAGTPRHVYHLDPTRMTPAISDSGMQFGWVLDHPQNRYAAKGGQPMPLMLNEVQQFMLAPDDRSPYGIGIPEAASVSIRLSRLSSTHAVSTMGLGGRLTGMVSPAPTASPIVNEDEWDSIVRDWRTLANDPDAAKRLQVVRTPVQFTQIAASPSDLQLVELMGASRDDILGGWSTPVSQLGLPSAAGLNSGDARKDDAEVFWEGAIKPRLTAFQEGVQAILNRWEARIGWAPKIVFDAPTFDDLEPAAEIAMKTTKIAMTWDERRGQIGLDPLEDQALGSQVWIEQTMVPLSLAGTEPQSPTPQGGEVTASPSDELAGESEVTGKADTPLRARVESKFLPRVHSTVTTLLSEQLDRVGALIEERWAKVARKPTDTTIWWNEKAWNAAWAKVLTPVLEGLATATSAGASRMAERAGKASVVDDVLDVVRASAASRIVGINDTTRAAVARMVADAIAGGQSPQQLRTTLRDSGHFGETRADVIARTETMLAYNESALTTYRHHDVEYVDALDGDKDDECANRMANNPWKVEDALGQQDHPNGTLDWVPIVKQGKAAVQATDNFMGLPAVHFHLPESMSVEMPTPVVNVTVPQATAPEVSVTVEAPEPTVVNVAVPEAPAPVVTVNVPEGKADRIQRMEIVSMPARLKKARRNRKGEIDAMLESDA